MEVSDEQLMKPNELPPHIKRYFMDYVDVYELMDKLIEKDKIILDLKDKIKSLHVANEVDYQYRLNNVVKYGMDYSTAAELMNQLSLEKKKSNDLSQELDKTKLQSEIYKKHLLGAIHALEMIKEVGLGSPEAEYAKKCLAVLTSSLKEGDSPKAIHARIAPEQSSRSYTDMVMTHFSSPESPRDRLNFGLQSSLLRLSFLLENILRQIRLSTSQRFRSLLSRFYRAQDGFQRSNRISKFQRTNTLYSLTSGEGIRRTKVRIPYISALKDEVLRYV